ncbi:DUF6141 family protein [Terribacillus saccharophilus]|uniref:DUF6141 family protein n=1 Tax=Terribacillus saccharophilus TaxID=361277 RepID=UPI0039826019
MIVIETNKVIYKEIQRPRQPLLWLIILTIAGITWYGFILQVVLGLPFGSNPAPNAVVILFWIIFGIASPVIILKWTKLVVEVREGGLYIRFIPFHFHYKTFLYKDIKHYKAIQYSPLKRFGGWGLRVNFKGEMGYIMSSKKGIELTLKHQTVVISSLKPEETIKGMEAFHKIDL